MEGTVVAKERKVHEGEEECMESRRKAGTHQEGEGH